ncbi:MAG TPA: serine hydrolase domain-containing protein, partial [Candidatus Baltobacteraceae bacterium]|nr:serine hydrolase domain-containing protein [Candidatus Baltobacteraceae bacterium]
MRSLGTRIDEIASDALGSWATAIVARIEHRGRLVFERAYGTTRDDEASCDVYVDTRFDLASLTKLFVSFCLLQIVAEGRLHLDEPLASRVPQWRNSAKAVVTPRMLLSHTSGMQSGADYRTLLDRNVMEFALESELAAPPGERVIYSDLGLIALAGLLERIEGRSLRAIVAARIGRPSLQFTPSQRERDAIPATEFDGWRGRVQGAVHDEKAALMGGVAGHAGLFGTAADVAWLTDVFLAACTGRPEANLRPDLARSAVQEAAFDPVLRRGLGWALKTSGDNSCG